ncbi:hypothetical protein Ae201684P_012745 [Aphanomyces euteiches]|nr:hypothetical protein Ae201684P_012745 [Aphanomyces euteiches]KAH9156443.1 hypothetical protein AeRB84_001640 [Aphanomyces euteiches]
MNKLLTSFAAKGVVHAHINVEESYDAKYKQCMDLLRAYLPGDTDSTRSLELSDLILSIEAAQLFDPLVEILCMLHPTDMTTLAESICKFHLSDSPLQARVHTLEALLYVLALFICGYDPKSKSVHVVGLKAISPTCNVLRRTLSVLQSDDGSEVPFLLPDDNRSHSLSRLLKAISMGGAVSVGNLILEVAQSAEALCDHSACVQPSYRHFTSEKELKPKLSPLSGNCPSSSSTEDDFDDWYDEPESSREQSHQTFARLLSTTSWSPSDISWMQTYLESIEDLHVLSLHVGCVINAKPAHVSVNTKKEMQKLFNFVTPMTPPHAFLRLAAWAVDSVCRLVIHHGCSTQETRPLYVEVLVLLQPSIPKPKIAIDFLGELQSMHGSWHGAVAWAKLLVDHKLVSLSEIFIDCVIPIIENDSEQGWKFAHALLTDSNVWLNDSSASLVVESAANQLRQYWSLTKHADEVYSCHDQIHQLIEIVQSIVPRLVPNASHLVCDDDDIRLIVMLDPSCPLSSWMEALSSSSLTQNDVIDFIWGAIYGNYECIAALPRLEASLQSNIDSEWLVVIHYAVHEVSLETNASQFNRLYSVCLPAVLPPPESKGKLTLPDQETSEEFEWTPALWTVECVLHGLLCSRRVPTLRHFLWAIEAALAKPKKNDILYCFGRICVVLNLDWITQSMTELLTVQLRQILSKFRLQREFEKRYLEFCVQEVHNEVRKTIFRLLPKLPQDSMVNAIKDVNLEDGSK